MKKQKVRVVQASGKTVKLTVKDPCGDPEVTAHVEYTMSGSGILKAEGKVPVELTEEMRDALGKFHLLVQAQVDERIAQASVEWEGGPLFADKEDQPAKAAGGK